MPIIDDDAKMIQLSVMELSLSAPFAEHLNTVIFEI